LIIQFNRDMDAAIISLRTAHTDWHTIAKRVGVHVETAKRRARQLDPALLKQAQRRMPWTVAENATLHRMWPTGASYKAISLATGRSVRACVQQRAREGLEPRIGYGRLKKGVSPPQSMTTVIG